MKFTDPYQDEKTKNLKYIGLLTRKSACSYVPIKVHLKYFKSKLKRSAIDFSLGNQTTVVFNVKFTDDVNQGTPVQLQRQNLIIQSNSVITLCSLI